MAGKEEVLVRKAFRPVGKRPKGTDVGAFLGMVLIVMIALVFAYALGIINELLLLVGLILVLAYMQMHFPPVLVELQEFERAVVFRYGKFVRVAEPGWLVLVPFIDHATVVDTRVVIVDEEFNPQEVVTKDNIKLVIDAIMYLKVTDPKAAVINVEDPIVAAASYVRAHLRDIIGKMEMSQVISEVHVINSLLHAGVSKIAKDWGVAVEKVEIQSVELPEKIVAAMHDRKSAEQRKYAAEEDAKAQAMEINAVREAAGKLNDPALQYLYLQALGKLADGRASKIIFPLELTHIAERLSAGLAPKQRDKVEDDLRKKYDEFLLEESRDGVPISRDEVKRVLRKKTEKK